MTSVLQPLDFLYINTAKQKLYKWINHQVLGEQNPDKGTIIIQFSGILNKINPDIGVKSWYRSSIISKYDSLHTKSVTSITDVDVTFESDLHANDPYEMESENEKDLELVEIPDPGVTKPLKQKSITSFFKKQN